MTCLMLLEGYLHALQKAKQLSLMELIKGKSGSVFCEAVGPRLSLRCVSSCAGRPAKSENGVFGPTEA